MKNTAAVTIFIYAALLVGAAAQTTPQTTANITITNNLSKTLTIESSTCGSTETCTINQNSAMTGKSASESLVTNDTNSGSWIQRWGGYVGTTDYGCNFSLFADSVASGSTCHNLSGSASASSGPGGGHPSCSWTVTHQATTAGACSDGAVTFTINQ